MATSFELLQRVEFFAGLDSACATSIAKAVRHIVVPTGTTLIQQGEIGDMLFVVLHGRFIAELTEPDGSMFQVGEIGPGEMFGEMAMLSEAPRATTVRALRESEVVQLSRPAFEQIAMQYPELMRRLAALLALRLRVANDPLRSARVFRTIGLIPHGTDGEMPLFAAALAREISSRRETVLVVPDAVAHLGSFEDPAGRDRLLAWMVTHERENRVLLLVANTDPAWNEIILGQADIVLVVADAGADSAERPVETLVANRLLARRELLLMHDPETMPVGTRRWLTPGRFKRHHHLRRGQSKDIARLARWLNGQSIGVAFGGGGARSFAQIGLIRALSEAGVAVDRVGGTSMGSLLAATAALEWDWEATMHRLQRAFAKDPLRPGGNIPLVSLGSGRRLVQVFQDLFGEIRAEDCWLPFFCVLSDMTKAEAVVRRDGLLWQRLRASSALPGITPPVIEKGEFFLDGALLNNLPADVLVDEKAGPVVAMNVSPREELRTTWPDNYALSGWKILWDRIRGRSGIKEYPSMLGVLQRTVLLNSVATADRFGQRASFYLHPRLDDFEMFGWEQIETLQGVGYRFATARVGEWMKRVGIG